MESVSVGGSYESFTGEIRYRRDRSYGTKGDPYLGFRCTRFETNSFQATPSGFRITRGGAYNSVETSLWACSRDKVSSRSKYCNGLRCVLVEK